MHTFIFPIASHNSHTIYDAEKFPLSLDYFFYSLLFMIMSISYHSLPIHREFPYSFYNWPVFHYVDISFNQFPTDRHLLVSLLLLLQTAHAQLCLDGILYFFGLILGEFLAEWREMLPGRWSLPAGMGGPSQPQDQTVLMSLWMFLCEANVASGGGVAGHSQFAFLFSWMKLSIFSCSHVISFFLRWTG